MKKLIIAAVLGIVSVSSVAGVVEMDSYQCFDAYKRTNAARFHYEKISAQVIGAEGVLKDSKIYCYVRANLTKKHGNSLHTMQEESYFSLITGWVYNPMSEADIKEVLDL